MSCFDESNAFTSVVTPRWFWGWCTAPPIQAGLIWDALPEDLRCRVDAATWVYPQYCRLPMGSSHSVHLLMNVNMAIIGRELLASARLRPHRRLGEDAHAETAATDGDPDDADEWHRPFTPDVSWKPAREYAATTRSGGSYSVAEWVEAVREARRSAVRVLVIMHFFAGPRREGDLQEEVERRAEQHGLHILMCSIDLLVDSRWDLSELRTFDVIMATIAEGLIDIVVAGPPCSTWSRARHVWFPGGPRPLRRRGELCWGIPGLRPHELSRLEEGNTLMLNTMAACEGVSARGGAHAVEHPDDPGDEVHNGEVASIWVTDEMTGLEDRTDAKRFLCHQCMLGGPAVKPTCISGTLDGLDMPPLVCDGCHEHVKAYGLDENSEFRSAPLSRYPPGLCSLLAECVITTLLRFRRDGTGPTGWQRTSERTLRVGNWSRRAARAEDCAVAVLNEDAVRGKSVTLQHQQLACYVHVDDGVLLASRRHPGLTDKVMHRCADALEAAGFHVPDRVSDGSVAKIIGYEPQSRPARLLLPSARAVLLIDALRQLARQQPVEVDQVRSLLGVWIWGALLKRELLSVPQSLFQFVDKFAGRRVDWWPTARRELLCMASLVQAMYADLGAKLTPTVFATDAMGASEQDAGGFGIVATRVAPQVAKTCFEDALEPGFTVCRLDGKFRGLKRPDQRIGRTVPFTKLPDELFDCQWSPLLWGRWQWEEHITLGEGRAVLKLLNALAGETRCHRHRVLSLQDNRPVAGAFGKGRSTAGSLNRLCRQKASLAVAAEISLLLPWVQSPKMPADALSRRIEGQEGYDPVAAAGRRVDLQQPPQTSFRRPQG